MKRFFTKPLAITLMILFVLSFTACDSKKETDSPHVKSQSQASNSVKKSSGNNEIGNGFVDDWYLFGDLDFNCLSINDTGEWSLSAPEGTLLCEGTATMQDGLLYLYSQDNNDVGFIEPENDELKLTLTKNYESLMTDYTSGDLVFIREGASIKYELQH